jgi:hypothetical protein
VPLFLFDDRTWESNVAGLLRRLPAVSGAPIRIQNAQGLQDRRGPIHAGAFLRERRIVFDCTAAEFPRIFVHELFHFIWLRAGNPMRRGYEGLLAVENRAGAAGELGWSAEWRKQRLCAVDIGSRTGRWREYCCESFCDTAAWAYSGVRRHPEFTLSARFRASRRKWMREAVEHGRLSI